MCIRDRLNDDDHLAPGALREALALIDKTPSCTGVYGPSIILSKDGDFLGMHPAVDPKRMDEVFSNNIISQPSCFVKHARVKNIGGINKKLHYTMDWDLWTRLIQAYPNSFIYSDEIISAVTFAKETKTAKISFKRMFEIYAVTKRYNSLKRSMVTVFSFLKWGVGREIQTKKTSEFFCTQTNQYAFWDYGQDLKGIQLRGNLTSRDIEAIERANEMKMVSSHENTFAFRFNRPVPKGQLAKIYISDDIEHHSISFEP